MEWGGLLIQALMLGGFLLWEGFFKQKGKNLAIKDDARDISYEQEKGKNLATKDDIEKITKKIESVKNEISFYKQREDEFLKERKQAYLDFINCADRFHLYRSRINLAFSTLNDSSYAHLLVSDLTNDFNNFEKSFRNILVYYTEKSIVNKVQECYSKINKYAALFYDTIIKSIPHIDRQSHIINNPQYSSQSSENQQEVKKRYDEYHDKVDEYEREYIEGCNDYTILLSVLFELDFHQKKICYTEESK